MVYGYLRVSTNQQSVEAQKSGINEWCKAKGVKIEKWISENVSGVVEVKRRKLGGLVPNLKKGDTLVVSELSRLGRSVSMITRLVERLLARKVKIVLVKQGLTLGEEGAGLGDMITKMFVCISAVFAEMERDLIVARVKEGIHRKIASGYDWGSQRRGLKYNSKGRRLRDKVYALKAEGKTINTIAKEAKLSWGTVNRVLNEAA